MVKFKRAPTKLATSPIKQRIKTPGTYVPVTAELLFADLAELVEWIFVHGCCSSVWVIGLIAFISITYSPPPDATSP